MPTNLPFSLKSLTCATILLALLTSCTTPKKVTTTKAPEPVNQPVEDSNVNKFSSQYYLEQAKALPADQAIESLVLASEQLLLEGRHHQALWLANQTWPLLTSNHQNVANFYYRLSLVKATGLQALAQSKLAAEQLAKADKYAQENNIKRQGDYFVLAQIIAQDNHLTVQAINAQLNAFPLNSQANDDDIIELWQALTQLSQWQISQLSTYKPSHFSGWEKLLAYSHKYGDRPTVYNRALIKWQQSYPLHPANALIEQLKQTDNTATDFIENIAIILPLSGKQKSAGEAAQQGLLSAYESTPDKTLHFFDETQLDMSTLNQIFIEKEIDFVIGPLLKTNVESYLARHELTVPTLLLNLPNIELLPHQKAFSMRREDEAIQAAATLSQRSYKHPLVLSSKTSVSNRVSKAFIDQWQLLNGQAPEIVYFEQGNKMQNDLKTSLDVTASQQRINELNRRLKQKIKSELRNRRDIDMIYVVGSPKQTRLLKPYIDVNISPFSELIPVFASSLSHSASKDNNDNRDLLGLTFTEMPWLLNSKQQNKNLAQTSQQLWARRTDSLQRIFAMGYDSLLLTDKLDIMDKKPYVRHFGQTGVIKLNDNNILTRSLIWGRYRKSDVQQTAM